MKKHLVRNIIIVIAALLLVFIFGNSFLPAKQSNDFSFWVMDIVERLFPWLKKVHWMTVHAVLRKVAHGIEFAILGALFTILYLKFWKRDIKQWAWIPAACSLGAACLDEFIQSFIPTRCASLKDVGLDFGSALVGIAITYLIAYLHHKRKQKKERSGIN